MTTKTKQTREITRFNIDKRFIDTTDEPGIYIDKKLTGFGLRVRDKTKTYIYRAKQSGTHRVVLVTIGRHGDKFGDNGETLTLARAREEAAKLRGQLLAGINPNDEQRKAIKLEQASKVTEQKDAELKKLTLRIVFLAWCQDERKTKQSTKNLYREVMFKHLTDWLDTPLSSITPAMVTKSYDRIADQTIASANNTFRALRRLYSWAMVEYVDKNDQPLFLINPVSVLSKRDKWRELESRTNYIDDEDLKKWFDAVLALPNDDYRDYFILLLLTGLRRDEASGLKWEDIKFKQGLFIARDTKNGRDHVLPLTDYVHKMLESKTSRKTSKYVFPGTGRKEHIVDARYYQQQIVNASGVEFSPHALRRTFSYAAARVRLGESERKALLNHLDSSNVTELHYTPWAVEHLKEPLMLVQTYLLQQAGQLESANNIKALKPTTKKVVSLKT